MENDIKKILDDYDRKNYATNVGNNMHIRLGQIEIDGDYTRGDDDLIQKIMSTPELPPLFSRAAQREIPIAGIINNRFISRRIDRMLINHTTQVIWILDYKTDTDKNTNRTKYIAQLHEYTSLIRQIYPKYRIYRLILWTHDWTLEHI